MIDTNSLMDSRKFKANLVFATICSIFMVGAFVLTLTGQLKGEDFVVLVRWAIATLGAQGGLFSLAQAHEDAAKSKANTITTTTHMPALTPDGASVTTIQTTSARDEIPTNPEGLVSRLGSRL